MTTTITAADVAARALDLMEEGRSYSAADLAALREQAARDLAAEAAEAFEVGDTFRWEGGPKVTILAIEENPQAAFAGNRLAPYATVQWSDDKAPSHMNLAGIRTALRSGVLVKVGR